MGRRGASPCPAWPAAQRGWMDRTGLRWPEFDRAIGQRPISDLAPGGADSLMTRCPVLGVRQLVFPNVFETYDAGSPETSGIGRDIVHRVRQEAPVSSRMQWAEFMFAPSHDLDDISRYRIGQAVGRHSAACAVTCGTDVLFGSCACICSSRTWPEHSPGPIVHPDPLGSKWSYTCRARWPRFPLWQQRSIHLYRHCRTHVRTCEPPVPQNRPHFRRDLPRHSGR